MYSEKLEILNRMIKPHRERVSKLLESDQIAPLSDNYYPQYRDDDKYFELTRAVDGYTLLTQLLSYLDNPNFIRAEGGNIETVSALLEEAGIKISRNYAYFVEEYLDGRTSIDTEDYPTLGTIRRAFTEME